VSSAAGRLVVPAHVTDALPTGVALIPKGTWPKRRFDGANVNVLTSAQRSDMGASTAVHGLEVVVTAAEATAPT
jgi:anaerobic selenocysteine-containing dehydrogenase